MLITVFPINIKHIVGLELVDTDRWKVNRYESRSDNNSFHEKAEKGAQAGNEVSWHFPFLDSIWWSVHQAYFKNLCNFIKKFWQHIISSFWLTLWGTSHHRRKINWKMGITLIFCNSLYIIETKKRDVCCMLSSDVCFEKWSRTHYYSNSW